jgi:hypothetical protein
MSTPTLTRSAGDFGDWDEYLAFAAITEGFDRDDLPEPDPDAPHVERRRARGADKRAAINESLREV